MINERIAVLIVTYGDRHELLRQVVDRLLDLACENIIIVDNGAKGSSIEYLNRLDRYDKITIIRNYSNLGSAGGVSIGLQYFLTLRLDYLWILDDDNVPDEHALRYLKLNLNRIDPHIDALHSLRFSEGQPAFPRNALRSSFFEFNLLNYMPFFSKRVASQPRILKYAPYGGLFISSELIKKIGLPIKDMYLYVDDTEYTWRITQDGGKIILVEESIVIDVDKNWGINYPSPRSITQLILEDPFFRGFYTIRNHAFFDRNIWRSNLLLHKLNKLVFLLILFVLSLRFKRLDRFFEVLRAVNQGESCMLGERLKK